MSNPFAMPTRPQPGAGTAPRPRGMLGRNMYASLLHASEETNTRQANGPPVNMPPI